MNLPEVVEQINQDRARLEASFIFCLWKNPTLYDDYMNLNTGEDKTLITEDGRFYFALGRKLREQGLNNFDAISVDNYLASNPQVKQRFEERGGWKEVETIRNLVNEDNVEAYYNQIVSKNMLISIGENYEKLFGDVSKFKNLSPQEIYDTFDIINAVSDTNNNQTEMQSLYISDEDLARYDAGEAVGISYAASFPLLNYITLGLPRGDITLLSGHSGVGKSSFAFYLIMGVVKDGSSVGIISNEMQIDAYKNLLLIYTMVNDLDYWKMNRKEIKRGHWKDEYRTKLKEAQKIANEKYASLVHFVKVFGNNSATIMKQMKRLNRTHGVNVFLWDTYKADDTMNDKMWQELLMSSRKVFNMVAKENMSLICTFQLALYTVNQRWLDAGCLSSSKQIKEVVSEHIMLRKLWHDEYTGEKYDCKPYKIRDGKPEDITLDKDKTYVVAFIDKTRNDENSKCLLYRWDSVWNKWKELGYCRIVNDHRGSN